MKTINLLKKALDIFIVLLILLKIYLLGLVIFYFLYPDLEFFQSFNLFPTRINQQPIKEQTVVTSFLWFIDILASLLFLFTIVKFKKFISGIQKESLFSINQEKSSKVIGILLLFYATIKWLPLFIYKHFLETSPRTVNYDVGDSDSFYFVIILGLLFIFLAKAFQTARIHKEDNELTI